MRLSLLLLLFVLPLSLAEEGTPISAKISGYFIVFFLLLSAVIVKYILLNCRSRGISSDSSNNNNNNNINGQVGDLEGLSVGIPQESAAGVDRNLINSLPVFEYASLSDSTIGPECAVCLGSFEDKDLLHLLPKCRHAFHGECIDKWLEDHSTCPVCRQSVEAEDISAFVSSNSRDCPNVKEDDADRKAVHGFEHRITVSDANFDSHR